MDLGTVYFSIVTACTTSGLRRGVCGQGALERPEPALASWERLGWPGWTARAAREVLTGLSVTSDHVCAVEAPVGEAVRVGRTLVYLGAERE